MTASSTPADARDDHKERVALGLQSIRLAAGRGSLKGLSRATGVSEALWKRWEDPDDHASISLPDVATLAESRPAVAQRILRLITKGMGLELAPAREAVTLADDLRAAGAVLSSAGALAQHHATSVADEHLDPDEAAAGLPLAEDAERSAATLKRRYQDVLKSRGAKALRAVEGGAS